MLNLITKSLDGEKSKTVGTKRRQCGMADLTMFLSAHDVDREEIKRQIGSAVLAAMKEQ